MTSAGNGHSSHLILTKPPSRVVSLVPSITQSIIDLDFGESVVGVTEYCPQLEGRASAEIIGGTHGVDIAGIKSLNPDLIFANQEENDRADVEALEAAGFKVWVSFPRSVRDAIQVLWVLVRVFGGSKEATAKVLLIERSLEWVEREEKAAEPDKVFVPIWQEHHPDMGLYWMTFNSETYCDSVVSACGGLNVFRARQRRYPLEAEFDRQLAEESSDRDYRYPRIGADEILEAAPEMIILPSEPFNFSQDHLAVMEHALRETPAVQNDRIIPVDGRWLSWHGTMLAHALVELPPLFD